MTLIYHNGHDNNGQATRTINQKVAIRLLIQVIRLISVMIRYRSDWSLSENSEKLGEYCYKRRQLRKLVTLMTSSSQRQLRKAGN